jgi:hypothetical protein
LKIPVPSDATANFLEDEDGLLRCSVALQQDRHREKKIVRLFESPQRNRAITIFQMTFVVQRQLDLKRLFKRKRENAAIDQAL